MSSSVATCSSLIAKGFYRHYKGNFYEVLNIVKHADDASDHVLYQQRYGNRQQWVRRLPEFEGYVMLDGKQVKLFTLIEGSAVQ